MTLINVKKKTTKRTASLDANNNNNDNKSQTSSMSDNASSGGWSACFLKHQGSVSSSQQELIYQTPRSSSLNSLNIDNEHGVKNQMELASLRFVKGKLYGRSKEIQILRNTFQQASSSSSKPVVIWVSGLSGVGKTALVEFTLKNLVVKAGGIFATGKYDFQQQAVPYLGITEVCRQVCEQILGQQQKSNEQQEQQKKLLQLKQELGSSMSALAKLVPSKLFAGENNDNNTKAEPQPPQNEDTTTMGVSEAQNRFIFAIGTFLRNVAGSWGPLVMSLDDLQWADVESLHLLETLMTDPNMKGLMMVGCYRSNEVDETHLLNRHIRVLESNKDIAPTIKLELSALDKDAVNDMLVDVLSLEDHNAIETSALADLVHKRTHGNAFFVIQYLKMLQEKGILEFQLGLMKWVWSLEEVETKTGVTENVIDLMRNKMTSLPKELCEVLPLVACLGSTFNTRKVSVVVDAFQAERGYNEGLSGHVGAEFWLEACSNEGFIEMVDQESFRWVHDKIQEAALGLIIPDKLPLVQYRVGEVLLQRLAEAEITEFIFVVVNLLNKSIGGRGLEAWKRLRIAELNLQAGKAAMVSSSFGQAAHYLQTGIQFLPNDHWKTQYELSLDLYSAAAEAEYCTGAVEAMDHHCRAIIAQKDRPVSDKFRAYNVLIPSIGNTNRAAEACDLLVHHLKELRCTFPIRGQLIHVVGGILKVKNTLKKYTPEDFANFKVMEDETKIHTMNMLDKLTTFSYFLESSLLLPLAIFKSFQYTLDYGVCEYSPATFACVAMILITKLRVSLSDINKSPLKMGLVLTLCLGLF